MNSNEAPQAARAGAAAPALSDSLITRIRGALIEDLGEAGDVTTNAIFDEHATASAHVVAKEPGVLCGVRVFAAVFEQLPNVTINFRREDGERVSNGDVVIELEGSIRSLLAGERTALNFLQRMSGIATQTARFVEAARGRLQVCDTRKTTPLWRDLEKHAVACGGGTNHRMGLYDMIMLKDTHADGAGGIANALRLVNERKGSLAVAAEARTLDEVRAVLEAGADLIMLDNMDDATMREAVRLIDKRIPTEITGGVTVERIALLADIGIDRVSVGALTHSVRALDFSMRLRVSGTK
ncbi:MAG TPA: carboxylating nicotinate-nucleotide diphosphorylase [Candidatus Sumerlaeota bacterium]|nr:carboxylating nicotinate-nucleotide diphosphorylase [Candidatus Sumerlaeota bacterium]